jgi:hypothetical protein
MAGKSTVAQKRDNEKLFWVLRLLLTLILFVIVFYVFFVYPCPYSPQGLPLTEKLLLLAAAFVIFLVIVIVLKSPPVFSIAVVVLLALFLALCVLLSLEIKCPTPLI